MRMNKMAHENLELLLAGVGGQGIVFAGQILMEAALRQGYKVYGFEEHGMARRGGAVASHIRFGENIFTPLIPIGKGNVLAAFEPAEALRHIQFIGPHATIILNTKSVIPSSVSTGKHTYPNIEEIIHVFEDHGNKVLSLDATTLAEESGNSIAMNVVMLGAICKSDVFPLPKDDIKDVIKKRSPSYSREINLKAFDYGFTKIEDE
ncbi:MAG: indolepyruvate oxidoreductase subunit beta [Thermoplasmata archaeon]|nr:MAG: indolepyruvate oxidoreductase subunit beta [Thermoplasmata archaeon]